MDEIKIQALNLATMRSDVSPWDAVEVARLYEAFLRGITTTGPKPNKPAKKRLTKRS